MTEWYCHTRSETLGPGSTEDMVLAISEGNVAFDAQVCRLGDSTWLPLSAVPEFATAMRGAAPPPPPPPPSPPAPQVIYTAQSEQAPQIIYVHALPPGYEDPRARTRARRAQAKHDPLDDLDLDDVPSKCSRVAYVLFGFFLGGLGVHNFYAGYVGRGVAQVVITFLSLVFFGPTLLFVVIWVVVELFAITEDAKGRRFS